MQRSGAGHPYGLSVVAHREVGHGRAHVASGEVDDYSTNDGGSTWTHAVIKFVNGAFHIVSRDGAAPSGALDFP